MKSFDFQPTKLKLPLVYIIIINYSKMSRHSFLHEHVPCHMQFMKNVQYRINWFYLDSKVAGLNEIVQQVVNYELDDVTMSQVMNICLS